MQRNRNIGCLTAIGLIVAARCLAGEAIGDESTPDPVRRAMTVIETVLKHHVDPPTRQQMVLESARALSAAAERELPVGFARTLSDASGADASRRLLSGVWNDRGGDSPLGTDEAESVMIEAILSAVPGARRVSDRDDVAARQLAANRYVGTGIALGMNEHGPTINRVFEGGPVDRAGGRENDIIEKIDGFFTDGMSLRDVVTMLRGEQGELVELVLRQPDSDESRRCDVIRGVVPIKTVTGYRLLEKEDSARIAVLRIERIASSTVAELRSLEHRMRQDDARALILDLRSELGSDLHNAVLLADALLDGGTIGQVRAVDGTRPYNARPGCLFGRLPMALVVGGSTSGTVEWLAAALRDNDRAILIGQPTAGRPLAEEGIELPGSDDVLYLPTCLLLRGDGRSIGGGHANRFRASTAIPRVAVETGHPPGGVASPARGLKPDVTAGGEGDDAFTLAEDSLREKIAIREEAGPT